MRVTTFARLPHHPILIQQGRDFAVFNPRGSRTVTTGVPVAGTLGVAAAGRWLAEEFPSQGGHRLRIDSQRFHHEKRRTLVADADGEAALAARHGYLYWTGGHAIGRVPIAGGRPDRRFRPLTADSGGPPVSAAEGLTISGGYLYFSQCAAGRIGRVALAGPARRTPVEWIVHTDSCPIGLAVGDGNIFWDGIAGGPHDGESIGRAKLNGSHVQAGWIFMGLRFHIGDPLVYGHRLYWQGWNLRHSTVMHLYETRARARKARPHIVRDIGASSDITPVFR
jgi:hypothetical protein